MSNEIHHKTYEEMYYDSERLNMEAKEKLFHQSQKITHLESVIKDISMILEKAAYALDSCGEITCKTGELSGLSTTWDVSTKIKEKQKDLLDQLTTN